jgi:hypothetical protein
MHHKKISTTFIILVFTICYQTNAQNDVIDSLIDKNAYPIAYFSNHKLVKDNFLYSDSIYSPIKSQNFVIRQNINDRWLYQQLDTLSLNQLNLFRSSDNGNIEVYQVPKVFPIYIYPVFDKHKPRYMHKSWNYSVQFIIKNWGDNSWYLHDFDTQIDFYDIDSDSLILSTSYATNSVDKYPRKEGVVWNSKDMTNLRSWSPTTPQLYRMHIAINNDEYKQYNGSYQRVIGAREVYISEGVFYLNQEQFQIKAVTLPPFLSDDFELQQLLFDIKKHRLNTILVKGKVPNKLFDYCNKIGLCVIQRFEENDFVKTNDLLEYFLRIYTSPSLIAWEIDEDFKYYEILKSLDEARPIHSNIKKFLTINDWSNKSIIEKNGVKKQFSLFSTYLNPNTGVISLEQNERFRDNSILKVRCTIYDNSEGVKTWEFPLPKFSANKAEVISPDFGDIDDLKKCTYVIEVVVRNDLYPFIEGDIITSSTFKYVNDKYQIID